MKEKENIHNKQIPLVFTTVYNPHVAGFKRALSKHWDIINDSKHLKAVFPNKPILAFRRNKNLKDTLVRARLKPDSMEMAAGQDTDELDLLISLLRKDPDTSVM